MVDAQTFPDMHLESEAYGSKGDIQTNHVPTVRVISF